MSRRLVHLEQTKATVCVYLDHNTTGKTNRFPSFDFRWTP